MTLWNDNLLIGVREIDEQHKKLVQAIDSLMAATMSGKGKDEIQKTLDFVESYTKKHFADEEKLHATNGYPQAQPHKQLHEVFRNTLANLQKGFKATGPTSTLTIELNKTLVDWLTRHITIEDRKYAAFANAKK